MKFQFLVGSIAFAFALSSCSPSGPTEAELQAEAEADRLDSINLVMEQQSAKINQNAAALDAAMDSLDLLFPVEE